MSASASAAHTVSQALAARRRNGLPVLPLCSSEAGIPVHPALRDALNIASGRTSYGPVAGVQELRQAAAGYWERRGLPTDPELVVAGPGTKPLLHALLLALGGDIVCATPSWLGYTGRARLVGGEPIRLPAAPGEGGVPLPDLVTEAVAEARSQGRDIRAVVVTTPDNPTGGVPSRTTVESLAEAARASDLVIISNEIYRDLVHDAGTFVHSPAEFAPERTVVITGLSKSLALAGWRIGVARLPDSPLGHALRADLLGLAREIWSSPAGPVQHAAAYAFGEPVEITERVERSRRLHGVVAHAVGERLTRVGVDVSMPKAGFYLYPDFTPWAERLEAAHGIASGGQLAAFLLDVHGVGALPAAQFEGGADPLRLRLATGLLYGDTDVQRYAALAANDPLELPWIQAQLQRLEAVLESMTAPAGATAPLRG